MFGELGKRIRFWALITMIVCACALALLLFIYKVWFWLSLLTLVSAGVIIWEGLCLGVYGTTISTNYKEFAQRNRIPAYAGLFLLGLAGLSLLVHLAIW